MNLNNETNDLYEQIDQEINDQDYYGLQYVLGDLFPEQAIQTEQSMETDWFGLDDLTIQ
jgi:hypothetical protein